MLFWNFFRKGFEFARQCGSQCLKRNRVPTAGGRGDSASQGQNASVTKSPRNIDSPISWETLVVSERKIPKIDKIHYYWNEKITQTPKGKKLIFSGKYNPRSGAKPFFTTSANEQGFELWLRL